VILILAVAWMAFSGRSDSRASRIASDERVVFFDTAAWLEEGGEHWIIPIHGWIHEPEDSTVRKAALTAALETKYGLQVTNETRKNYDRRMNLFLVDNERGKRIRIRLGDRSYVMAPSEPNGHFYGQVRLPAAEVEGLARDGRLSYVAVAGDGDTRRFTGRVHLAGPTGLSVVSDIDDTIKITHVTDKARMFHHAFFLDYEAVPGMAQLYSEWARQGVRFHFVSSTPWQLYEPLSEFAAKAGFPGGTFHLKYIRLTDKTFWNLFKKGTETKPAQIEPLLKAYPGRRFVLVGDSGEEDPEVYAEMIRKYPKQVKRVYIRNVTNVSAGEERFGRVFRGIDRGKWVLFSDPRTLGLPR
jgi:phosphatidate phosphatase APP1